MKLEHGIALHDTLGRGFGRHEGQVVETSFRRWVSGVIAALEPGTGVAVDGKTSRRSGGGERRALHLVTGTASGIGVVLRAPMRLLPKSSGIKAPTTSRTRCATTGRSKTVCIGVWTFV